MQSRRYILFSLIFILSLILTACNKDNDVIESDNSTSVEQEDLSEQGQTLNIVSSDAMDKTTNEMEQYQIQTRLIDFHLIDNTTGLAWGITRKSLRLYLTEDNGETWINISPAENVQFTTNPKYGTDLFFIDKNNGWIIRDGQEINETVVLRTTNGGGQWKISALPKSDKSNGISFSTLSRGWIMTSSESSTSREEKYLYRTDDGGASWTKIMQNTGSLTSSSDTVSSISYAGNIKDMTFVDSLHGFVTVQDMETPKLYTTEDGGNTWNIFSDFIDFNKMRGCSILNLGTPRILNGSTNHGYIPLNCSTDEGSKFNGYFTTNKGQTWEFAPFNLKWANDLNAMLSPVFINENEGWYLHDSFMYHTVDRGVNWMELPASQLLQQYLDSYPKVAKIDFVSSNIGWILLENTEKKRSLLLQTINGGVSWEVL
ncbi:WD40/YVTN/BNR-like repeat-containing protein [Paenibacillus crassostreae]|uniref:Sortilin N-terminal domain-containing protein n=1 Tax=Paenibacillus crassostreae TaxID=1763538 RepID=A0A167DV99_9BACL|nr:hypothetical protein [Paenibacillus crassostreae]AOZ91021.1 hypothetical protein LPB68_01595 [Paenibacillus crassostreae]OAB74817.1 hypothetical protein PNBC_12360 [Paenibacillus crassostreae]